MTGKSNFTVAFVVAIINQGHESLLYRCICGSSGHPVTGKSDFTVAFVVAIITYGLGKSTLPLHLL